jgi:hypothetical protein
MYSTGRPTALNTSVIVTGPASGDQPGRSTERERADDAQVKGHAGPPAQESAALRQTGSGARLFAHRIVVRGVVLRRAQLGASDLSR